MTVLYFGTAYEDRTNPDDTPLSDIVARRIAELCPDATWERQKTEGKNLWKVVM
jgi:hypothetical protein